MHLLKINRKRFTLSSLEYAFYTMTRHIITDSFLFVKSFLKIIQNIFHFFILYARERYLQGFGRHFVFALLVLFCPSDQRLRYTEKAICPHDEVV